MEKLRKKNGFSLAEVLVVIGILLVLMAVSIVAVQRYLRSMTKLQYDGYAKEIFVAAQNHLSMAESQGYLGRSQFGTEEQENGKGTGVYYFLVNTEGGVSANDKATVLNLMLPMAAVDESVRMGGSYIVRYHKDSGQVLDVFYWSESAGRYPHSYENEYEDLLSKRENEDALKTYGAEKSVIGYYGGVEAASLTRGDTLSAPVISVRNAERLTVTVTDPNADVENARLKLVVTGLSSGNSREIALLPGTLDSDYDSFTRKYTVVLDDITEAGRHFYDLFCSSGTGDLIPGEDVTVQAVAFNNAQLTNVAYSGSKKTSSLFGDDSSAADGLADISNVRHLENLSGMISRVNASLSPVQITRAEQSTDLSWRIFKSAIGNDELSINLAGTQSKATKPGTYLPVDPAEGFEYDGNGLGITDVQVDGSDTAGLFGTLTGGSVHDLRLQDISIRGTGAGALACTVNGTTVTNVLAADSGTGTEPTISGSGSVGGLIGTAAGAAVEKCAAALCVRSTGGSAGGLIGTADDTCDITACYSGGHTLNGAYSKTDYNVSAAESAGGLVGDAGRATIRFCYSTCSARGAVAGGLAGAMKGAAYSCYAVGLVSGDTEGAFAGSFSGTADDCSYLEIVNQRDAEGGSEGSRGYTYLPALGTGSGEIGVLDVSEDGAVQYNTFTSGGKGPASPCDPALSRYLGKYEFRTVDQLGAGVTAADFVSTHYGDWPSPEIWIINAK